MFIFPVKFFGLLILQIIFFFIAVALSSVFPINEFPRFLALGKFDKERQIEEMAHVVSGIRIFNYHYHRQEDGIDDCKCSKNYVFLSFIYFRTAG